MSGTALTHVIDPARNSVVESCAGSGKTWLLVSRMIRLLLAGAKPSELLAITFTRKAAEEMRARLHDWLADLVGMDDHAAWAFLVQRGLSEGAARTALPTARRLYEQVLQASPGPMITTFHGWFLDLLRHAPVTRRAPSHLLEETGLLLEEAWFTWAESLREPDKWLEAEALDFLLRELSLHSARELLFAFIEKRAEWWAWSEGRKDPIDDNMADLAKRAAVDEAEDVLAHLLASAGFETDLRTFMGLLARNGQGVAEDAERALRLGDFLDTRPDNPDIAWQTLRDTFLTQKGTPLARKASGALSKRLGADAERFIALHQELSYRLMRALARLASQRALRLNRAVLLAGKGFLAQYQALKQARDALDFTDAEWLALDLLTDAEHADALLAKLDARWKHILLDEFQDANPLQWRIITAWLSAYGADPERPDLFVVGDPKQSIYRFRRAEPRLFAAAADFLATHFDAESHRQNHTRRCAPRVVAWVNGVFGSVQAETGGTGFAGFVEHGAVQAGLPGHGEVIIAPQPVVADETEAPAGLRDPLATPAPSRPNRRAGEAALVAARIRELVGRLWIAEDGGRAARYSDIYVLSASRTDIATFEDAFKAAGVPYVSSRRGGLLETLEVADVLALLGALVSPGDDLKLAHTLKSPIFGFGDEDLKYLARLAGGTWDARLAAWAESDAAPAHVPRARRLLVRWREAAGHLPPHDLLDSIYHSGDIEARYAAALPEALRAGALANLRGLLALSLEFASGRYPSLPRFLDELRAMARRGGDETPDEAPVAQGDVVRMFTIHGAKGLEAPIVFLIKADETGRDISPQGVLVDWPPERDRPDHFSVYGPQAWRGAERDDLFQQERLLADRERLNLLYVAMTRARQALFVSGLETDDARSWMARLRAALPAMDGTPVMAWRDDAMAHAEPGEASSLMAETRVGPIGSRLPPISAEAEFGILVHRYLERVTLGHDPATIRQDMDIDARAFDTIEGAAQACLRSDGARRFFDARHYVRARNEVEYMGSDGQRRRIDRLVEREDGIWVLDYKTGSLSEPDLSRRAQPYLEQLHEYTRAVRALYPGRLVRAALIFSDGGYWELPMS